MNRIAVDFNLNLTFPRVIFSTIDYSREKLEFSKIKRIFFFFAFHRDLIVIPLITKSETRNVDFVPTRIISKRQDQFLSKIPRFSLAPYDPRERPCNFVSFPSVSPLIVHHGNF